MYYFRKFSETALVLYSKIFPGPWFSLSGSEISATDSPEQSLLSSADSLDSQDTLILPDSPSRKRQRLDAEAKQVSAHTMVHPCDILNLNFLVLIFLKQILFAFKLVESVLTTKSGGERIVNEYNRTKFLGDETRRKMVNILAADMTEKNG